MRRLSVAVIAAVILALGMSAVAADTLTFFLGGSSDGLYFYRGEAFDETFETGNVVEITGIDGVTGLATPTGWYGTWGQFRATWTALQDVSGVQYFGVLSTELEGSVPWTITSGDSGSGTVTGPKYVPEPTTIALLCAGLLALGVGARRGRASDG